MLRFSVVNKKVYKCEKKIVFYLTMNSVCRISVATFCAQMIVVLILVVVSLYNLTMHHPHRDLWVSLLSTSIGLVLPNPQLKTVSKTPSSNDKKSINSLDSTNV